MNHWIKNAWEVGVFYYQMLHGYNWWQILDQYSSSKTPAPSCFKVKSQWTCRRWWQGFDEKSLGRATFFRLKAARRLHLLGDTRWYRSQAQEKHLHLYDAQLRESLQGDSTQASKQGVVIPNDINIRTTPIWWWFFHSRILFFTFGNLLVLRKCWVYHRTGASSVSWMLAPQGEAKSKARHLGW